MITDDRYVQHAGFDNYSNVVKRKNRKDEQPENAERIMILTNKETGILTESEIFVSNQCYTVQRGTQPVALGDVLRIHDYNYLMKVIDLADKLRHFGEKNMVARFGKIMGG